MPGLIEVVTDVCRLPIDFYQSNVSPIDLVRRSGYLKLRGDVTVERLSAGLAREPELVDAWLMWSNDNRSTPAWYIKELDGGGFEVGYYDHGRASQTVFDDRVRACAEYARHYLEGVADLIEGRSGTSGERAC